MRADKGIAGQCEADTPTTTGTSQESIFGTSHAWGKTALITAHVMSSLVVLNGASEFNYKQKLPCGSKLTSVISCWFSRC